MPKTLLIGFTINHVFLEVNIMLIVAEATSSRVQSTNKVFNLSKEPKRVHLVCQ